MTTSAVPRKRIRDLLRLSHSPNAHEAANARARAQELLSKHGLSEADVEEQAIETVKINRPLQPGNQREELARVVGKSRGVTVNNLSFKGYPEAARDARELFTALCNIVESGGAEMYAAMPSEGYIWRLCFWLGFVEGVQKTLDPEHGAIPHVALSRIVKSAAAPSDVQMAADMMNAMAQSSYTNANSLRTQAHDAGLALATSMPIPLYRRKS